MKVYIKPWAEALKSAKKKKNLVDEFNSEFGNQTFILGVSRRIGDWGYIRDAIKETTTVNGVEYTTYTIIHLGAKELAYDACCVEEITPEWLKEHGEVFAKDGYKVDTSCEPTDWDYNTHFNIIYKVKDALNTYFFYVHKFYEHGCGNPVITDFREIN